MNTVLFFFNPRRNFQAVQSARAPDVPVENREVVGNNREACSTCFGTGLAIDDGQAFCLTCRGRGYQEVPTLVPILFCI